MFVLKCRGVGRGAMRLLERLLEGLRRLATGNPHKIDLIIVQIDLKMACLRVVCPLGSVVECDLGLLKLLCLAHKHVVDTGGVSLPM